MNEANYGKIASTFMVNCIFFVSTIQRSDLISSIFRTE